MITLRELKHFRFPFFIFLINELIWLAGVILNNINKIDYFSQILIITVILNASVFTIWFTRRYFKGKISKIWWSLNSWRQILANVHLRKRFVILLVYRILLDIITLWILINISTVILTIIMILGYTFINILILWESQILLTRNYYILEYSHTIWLFLNILIYLNIILSIYFTHLWSMPFSILWSWAVMSSTLAFILYAITIESNIAITFFKTVVFLIANILFWYWGLKIFFITSVTTWLIPIMVYGLLILIIDIIYHHDKKYLRLLEVLVIFGLAVIILFL